MSIDTNIGFIDRKLFNCKYSLRDIGRALFAFFFILGCMSALTIFIHDQIKESIDFRVEYVNMMQEDIIDPDGNTILKAPDLVVEGVIDFPVSYNEIDLQGYILLDTKTGVKYMYLRSGDNPLGITRYWPKE